jgi:hypothetical protein
MVTLISLLNFVSNSLSHWPQFPGLSDHDIVLVDTNITPARQKPLKRLIYLWKKVNITNMANNLKVSLDKFMDCSDIKTPINTYGPTLKP